MNTPIIRHIFAVVLHMKTAINFNKKHNIENLELINKWEEIEKILNQLDELIHK